MRRCLIIFAKEPQRGKVKTRLKSYLSEEGLLRLYNAFLKDTLELAKEVKCEIKILAYDSGSEAPQQLKKLPLPLIFTGKRGKISGRRCTMPLNSQRPERFLRW